LTEFGVALTDDAVKGKGFGTEAIKLLIDYGFVFRFSQFLPFDPHFDPMRKHHR